MLRSVQARVLDADDEAAVRDLLALDPVGTCMLAGRIETLYDPKRAITSGPGYRKPAQIAGVKAE